MRRSTGVKWRLSFQWQSGRDPPELSPYMSRNLADITRLLQPRRGFSFEEAKKEIDTFFWLMLR